MKLIDLSPMHSADAARLHIAGQPGTFLTSLGPDVLTVLYHVLPQSPRGFGFVALADHVQPAIPLGFVAATTSTGRLFLDFGTRHLHRVFRPLVARFVQQPLLLRQSFQTVLYPFLHRTDGGNGDNSTDSSGSYGDNHEYNPRRKQAKVGQTAELLSIMVESDLRGQGIGEQLLTCLCQECHTRQLTALDVTVDANNRGARRFYERHGFSEQYSFQLYGRTMCNYRLHRFVVE